MIIFLPQVFTEAQLQATLGKLRQSLERVPADSTDKLESFLKVASSPGSSCTVLYCTVLYCTLLYFTLLYCTAGGLQDPPPQPLPPGGGQAEAASAVRLRPRPRHHRPQAGAGRAGQVTFYNSCISPILTALQVRQVREDGYFQL